VNIHPKSLMSKEVAAMRENFKTRDGITTYQIKNMTFVVSSVFNSNAKETLAVILLRLMKSDGKNEK